MLNDIRQKADKVNAENQAKLIEIARLYHRCFVQNKDGQKIFESWVRDYCMKPMNKLDPTQFELGVNDGKRQIVNEITNHISFITQLGNK